MRPLVTVALICYNHEEYVGAALDSILAQDYEPLQILVSDDASRDGTVDIVRRYQQAYPDKIELQVHPRNLGISGNTCSLYPRIRGRYVSWFAGDDLFLPGKISRQVAALEANPDAIMCYHDVEVFDDASGQTLYLYNQKYIGKRAYSGHIVPELLKYRSFVAAPSVMVRRDATASVMHRPDVPVCSDRMFCMEIAARGRVIFLDEPLVRYRRHPGNATNIVEVANEARVYDLMDQLYPQYRRSAQLGRARMYVLYTFKYLLERKFGCGIKQAGKLAKIISNNPRTLFFVFSVLCEQFICRVALLVTTGKLNRCRGRAGWR